VAVACLLALAATTACDPEEPAAGPSPTPPESPSVSEGSVATIEPKPAPFRVRVTRVAGHLGAHDRKVLESKVGKVVSGYLDDAFLGGRYPRSGFSDAFDTFSAGAARSARRDRDLLTNRELGPSTSSVVARRRTAYLSVLAPHRIAAGVTALVNLRFLDRRDDDPDQVVTVKGRLMLTRTESGGWKIFGYDLTLAAAPAGKDS
jgi:hypothetical protein